MWSFLAGSFLAALSSVAPDEAAEDMRRALGFSRRLDRKKNLNLSRSRSLLEIWDDRTDEFWIVVIADGYCAGAFGLQSDALRHANELFSEGQDDEVEVYCVDGMIRPLRDEIFDDKVDNHSVYSVCKENSLSFKAVYTADASQMKWEDLPPAHQERARENALEGPDARGEWLGGPDQVFYFLTDAPHLYTAGFWPYGKVIAGSADPNTTFQFKHPDDDPVTHRVSFVLDGALRDIDTAFLPPEFFDNYGEMFVLLDPSLEGFDPEDAAHEWYKQWDFPKGKAFGLEIDEEQVWFFCSERAHGRTTPKIKILAVEPLDEIDAE